jgi:hypothetical protein
MDLIKFFQFKKIKKDKMKLICETKFDNLFAK